MIKLVLNEEEFEKELLNGKVVVDFFAHWCGPCRMLAPVIEEVTKELNINLLKVDIDELESLPRKFNVMSIPTIMVFENGELKKQHTGYMDKEELKEILK